MDAQSTRLIQMLESGVECTVSTHLSSELYRWSIALCNQALDPLSAQKAVTAGQYTLYQIFKLKSNVRCRLC